MVIQQTIESPEEFLASWEQVRPHLNWLRELSITEKVSIFFVELIKSICKPSRPTRFFPNYCFNKNTFDAINSNNIQFLASLEKELITYSKELAYPLQIKSVLDYIKKNPPNQSN